MNLSQLGKAPETQEEKTSEPETENTTPDTGEVIYTCSPIQSYKVGGYLFVKSTLKLDPEAAEAFDTFLKTLPAGERSRVVKIDLARAERIAEEVKAKSGVMRSGVDTSDSGPKA